MEDCENQKLEFTFNKIAGKGRLECSEGVFCECGNRLESFFSECDCATE